MASKALRAVLISSPRLGDEVWPTDEIWVTSRPDWRPGIMECGCLDDRPIFTIEELSVLQNKTLEQLKSVCRVKRAFSGGKVLK